ncbi:MAG: response regulator transcription factor [Trueperaceae bacterium]|nr:response regulator transcription factor [Trueperaceae bacterium]
MRLLFVEDDARIAEPVTQALSEAGYQVNWVSDGETGLSEARAGHYGVMVLDVMLPGRDGFELARSLRAEGIATPIVFLTARGELSDRVAGLDLGGDAYLVKPFELAELLATLRAVVRRGEQASSAKFSFAEGRGSIDSRTRQVWWKGEEINLTAREYAMLETLVLTPGRWFSREELLDRVWGPDFYGEARIVDVYISYLRRKFDAEVIQSARGRGYSIL